MDWAREGSGVADGSCERHNQHGPSCRPGQPTEHDCSGGGQNEGSRYSAVSLQTPYSWTNGCFYMAEAHRHGQLGGHNNLAEH